MLLELLGLVVPKRVLEAVYTDPEPIESLLGPVDSEDGGPGVGLGYPPVPFEDDNLGPDLVVDAVPLVQNLLQVVLGTNKETVNIFLFT